MWRFMGVSFAFLFFAFYELSGGSEYEPHPDSLQVAMRTQSLFAQPDPSLIRARRHADAAPDVEILSGLTAQRRAARAAVEEARKARKEARYRQALAAQDAARFTVTLAASDRPGTAGFSAASFDDMGLTGVGAFSGHTLLRDADVVSQGGYEDVTGSDAQLAMTGEEGSAQSAVEDDGSGQNGEYAINTQYGAFGQTRDIREVTGDLVNMRSGPGTDFDRIDKLSRGTEVEVLESDGRGWVRLRVVETGEVGWVADWLVNAAAY